MRETHRLLTARGPSSVLSKLSVWLIVLGVLVMATGVAISAEDEVPSEVIPLGPPGTFPGCQWNCTANDVAITSVKIVDSDGNPITQCPEDGTLENPWVEVTISNGTGTGRYFFSFVADLYIDEDVEDTVDPVYIEQIYPCLASPVSAGESTYRFALPLGGESLDCGTEITLANIVIPWDTEPGDDPLCTGRPTDCQEYAPAQCYKPDTLYLYIAPNEEPPPTATMEEPTATATLEEPTATATLEEPTATATLEEPTAIATLEEPTAIATLEEPTPTNTDVPPTQVPATGVPPTEVPPTEVPPTATPEPEYPVLPETGAAGAGSGGLGAVTSALLAMAGGAAAWLRRKNVA